MKRIAIAALMLTACTPTSPPEAPGLEGRCVTEPLAAMVGRAATPRLVARAKARAGASLVRVIRPGQAVTMDFRQGRLNVMVDAQNKVERFTCG